MTTSPILQVRKFSRGFYFSEIAKPLCRLLIYVNYFFVANFKHRKYAF